MEPFAEIIREELGRKGTSAIREALRAGLNRDAIRSVLRGRSPSVTRAAEICEALGLEMYIGPRREVGPGGETELRKSLEDTLGALEALRAQLRQESEAVSRGAESEAAEDDAAAENDEAPQPVQALLRHGAEGARPTQATGPVQLVSQPIRVNGVTEFPGARPVDVMELSGAAGGGALDPDETVTNRVFFRRVWLDRHGLDPTHCVVIGVTGESMEPTLPEGCSILVDRSRRKRRSGSIFVVRTEDGLVVKRAGKDKDGNWHFVSDHPGWHSLPWPDETKIIGEVKWMARTL